MADIALMFVDASFDLALDGLDLRRDDGLETAVFLSLFTNRRATRDQLPAELRGGDLQGYWGDIAPFVEGDKFGSLLWLLAREKQTASTLARAKQYARDALQWFVDDRIAPRVDVATTYPAQAVMTITIDIYRPTIDPVRYRYDYEWAAQAAKRVA